MTELVKEIRAAQITWYAENDGAKDCPEWLSRITTDWLCRHELLRKEAPIFGKARFFITPAGCNALSTKDKA